MDDSKRAPGVHPHRAFDNSSPLMRFEVSVSQYVSRPLILLAIPVLAAGCNADDLTSPDLDAALAPISSSAIASGPFSDALPDGPIVTASDARNRALIIFPGATITDVDLNDLERDLTVAEVRLRPAGGGGEVKLHFSLANGKLVEAESEEAPFNYTFAPAGFVSLAEAISAATGANGKAGTVTEWKLQPEEGMRWQYRIWVSAADGDWRVRVNARTGTVNRVQDR